jgi:hypothetical protein
VRFSAPVQTGPCGVSSLLYDGGWEGGMCSCINFESQQCFRCLFEHLKHQSSVGLNPSLRYRFTVSRMRRFKNAFTELCISHCLKLFQPSSFSMGRDSSGGIATCYGLDGPRIESRSKRDFPHPSRLALGPTQPPIQWVPGLSRG